MKPTQEELQLKSDVELDELMAIAQGWEKVVINYYGMGEDTRWQEANSNIADKYYPILNNVGTYYIDHELSEVVENIEYHPTQNTTEGKAQCYDLLRKLYLVKEVREVALQKVLNQKSIVIAAIFSLQGG
jgi:hypothetical protein